MANTYETGTTVYSSRQRAVSLTLGVACSIPLTSTMALANVQPPTAFAPVTPSFHSPSQSFVHHAVNPLVHGNPVGVHSSVLAGGTGGNLNLASSSLSFLANNLANFSSLAIDVGGHQEQVGLTTKLTAAEVVAVEQVITGGSASAQTIKIGANGVADGGTVSLNGNMLTALDNSVGGSISSLTIARGVQVVDSLNSLSLAGNLSNYGSILTVAGSSGSSDTISANSILNAGGASIGSYSGGGTGSNTLFSADPVLNAVTSLTNSGSISSAGNLTISAPVVYNVASHGSAASINAAQNVNINTQNLTNSGTIAAAVGNVNLASSGGLNIAGAGGTLQANNGNINVSSNDGDINVSGGNLLSQQVNFNAGTGNVNAQMGEVTGVVNASGNSVHLGANTADLDLGTIDATGDPTITNTGNLAIDSSILATGGGAAGNLTLIAGGNITSASGNVGLNTSSAAGNGGELNLIAGAAFTPFTTTTFGSPQTGPTTVTKGSATGGFIDLTGGGANPILSINTSGTTQGGNIQMVAFAGTGAGSGTINVPTTVPINAAGPAPATSGTVSLIAGAKTGQAITTGAITGSTVSVDAATPVAPAKGVTYDATGLTATPFTPSSAGNAASATIGNVTGTLNAISGGVVTVANTSALTLGTVTLGKTGSLLASDSAGGIIVSGIVSGASATLNTTGGIGVSMSGTGSINTTTFNLDSTTAADTVVTDVSTLILNTGASVTDTQGAATLGLSGKAGGNLSVTSAAGQINVNAPLFVVDNTLTLSAGGKSGINIGAAMLMGTGTVNLTTSGTGKLTESAGAVVAGGKVVLTSNESFGSKTLGFLTNATSLSVIDVGTKNSTYVTDQNNQTLTFQGNPTPTAIGGSLFLTSVANTLNIAAATFNTVSITDTVANGGGINLSKVTMGGSGTFTVVSGSAINSNAATIVGSTVTMTGTAGVGTKANPIAIMSANLVLNSSQGNVFATDSIAATVNGSASLLGIFSVTDTGTPALKTGDSLTVGKSVGGEQIFLTTSGAAGSVALTGTTGTSSTSLVTIDTTLTKSGSITTKGAILGGTITFKSTGAISVGGAVGNAVSAIGFTSTSSSGITLGGALSGNNVTVNALDGPLTVTKAVSGSGPNSSITLNGDSSSPTGNAVVIGAAVTGSTIKVGLAVGGEGNIAVNAAVGNSATASAKIDATSTGTGGSVTGTGLVTGTNVTLSANNSIGTAAKPMTTSAVTLSANAAGQATGDGAFVTQKGNLALGTSNDFNLVVKVTGSLDVAAGQIVTAPNLNLSSTGTTTVDGTIQNAAVPGPPNTGTMVITSGGNFTVSSTGLLQTTAGSTPLTVNVTGLTTIDGNTAVAKLDLKSSNGFALPTTGVMSDGADNLTITGPFVVDGQLGNLNGSTVFNVVDTGSVVIGQLNPFATIIGSGTIQGSSIVNYVTLNGASGIQYIGTGTGNAFQNFGSVVGLGITVTTTNPLGVIFNAPGATIIATQTALTATTGPVVNLNTYGVNNEGTIGAIGLVEANQGILNITSPGALTISGNPLSFLVGNFNAVNLTAKGNVTVGGIVGGVTSNPFSNFTAANELGNFSVNTTGTFSTTQWVNGGISVMTNTTSTFGGTISITASNVLYNGVGAAPVFNLSAIGAGPLVSSAPPITLVLSGAQGININGTSGTFNVNAEGFSNTSLSTFSTPGPLLINTAAFNVSQTSLALTGTARVLIEGNLDEGTQQGTSLTITTASTSPFLMGGAAANTGNGQNGLLLPGQGISSGLVTINAPGGFTIGTSTGTIVDAVLTGSQGVTLNGQFLTINKLSDVVGLSLTLNVGIGNTTYTNLNTNGGVSASQVNINDFDGSLTLVSGGFGPTGQAEFSVGFNPNGPGNGAPVLAGGTFNINAQALTFSNKGLFFNATGGLDGGQVILNISGTDTGTLQTITIGQGANQISANVAAGANLQGGFDFEPSGSGVFRLTNAGNIIGTGIFDPLDATKSAINFGINGDVGGILSLIADGFNSSTGTGSTVLVSGVTGLDLNLLQLSSNSTTPLLASGATSNGVKDAGAIFFGGGFTFTNQGPVNTNGVQLFGTALTLQSQTSVITTLNSGFTIDRAAAPQGQTNGGLIQISAPVITTGATGLALVAQGGSLSGGSITVSTSMTPVSISAAPAVGNISFNVGDMVTGTTGNYVAGTVQVSSPGALAVNGSGIIFVEATGNNPATAQFPNGTPGINGTLILSSAGVNGTSTTGFPLTFTNAVGALGLNFSNVDLTSGNTAAFNMAGAAANGNGFVGASVLTAGGLTIQAPVSIVTTNEVVFAHSITLEAPSVTFQSGGTIAVQPDGLTVGITGPLATPTGSGGSILVEASAFAFTSKVAGVTLSAPGDGVTANSTGGNITISDNSTTSTNLAISSNSFLFNVSNAFDQKTGGQTAGFVSIANLNGNITIDTAGGVFTYGATGGQLGVQAQNIQVTGINALSTIDQQGGPPVTAGLGLAIIGFTTSSTNAFSMSSTPTINGFTDPQGTVFVTTALNIINSGTGGIDMTGAQAIQPNALTLTAAAGPVTFTAGQVVTATQSAATASLGTGGSININAASLVIPAGGLVTFNAVGNSATGTGGSVTIKDSASPATTLNISDTTGLNFIVTNNNAAGAAGAVSVTNSGPLTVNGNGLTYGPTLPNTGSGSLILVGTNMLLSNVGTLTGGLSNNPLASIQLTDTSAAPFVFGGALATGNGIVDTATTLTAFSVAISNTGGINTSGTTTVSSNSLTLSTPNTITLVSGAGLTVTANPTTFTGGTIGLAAGAIAYTGAGNALLSAPAIAGGGGGTITVTDGGITPLIIGATGLLFNVSGSGAGQLAGTVKVSNDGNLNVDGTAFTFGPAATGNVGSGILSLSGTNLLVSNIGAVGLSAIPLSSITLTSSSSSDFVFGGATINGFVDVGATLTAASVFINNNVSGLLGGGITTKGGSDLAATNISLVTQNTVTFLSGSTLTAVANSITGAAGSITVTTGAIAYTLPLGGGVNLVAVGTGTGDGGQVKISVASTALLDVGANALQINVSNTANATGGTVSIVNGGAITADCSVITLGGPFVGNTGPSVTINANGALALSNVANINPPLMGTLAFSSDSIQAFVLGGAAANTNGITDNALSLAAGTLKVSNQGGAIAMGTAASLNGSLGMTLAASTDIGGIAPTANIVLGGTVANAATVFNAGGGAFISITDTAKTSITNAYEIGALQITSTGSGDLLVGATGGNFSATNITISYNGTGGNTNTVTLGNMAATDGNLSLASNAENVVQTAKSVISAYNGSVSLQNDSTLAGANINVQPGQIVLGILEPTTIHASGSLVSLTQGDVSVFIGPAGFTSIAGATPATNPNIFVYSPGGAVNFSSGTFMGGTITADASDILQGLARTLAFTTNGLADTAITLGALVQITADPPGITGFSLGAVSSGGNTSTLPFVPVTLAGSGVLPAVSGSLAGAGASTMISGNGLLGSGNGLLGAGNFGAAGANTAAFNFAGTGATGATGAVNASSGVQSSLNGSNVLNTSGAATSGFSLGAINNSTVNTMTVGNTGVSAGFLSSTSSSATAQNLGENAAESTTGGGSSSSVGNTMVTGGTRTLTGGVTNTLHRSVDRGPILVSPLQNEVIETPFGTVSVAANSVALIITSDDGLAVYNLHDSRKNAVVINNGTRTIPITPGRSAVLTRSQAKSFEEVNPARFVSYRQVAGQAVSDSAKLYQADFDIKSLMHGLPAIRHLMASDSAQTRKTMGNMLKTAAILMQISQSSEPYALYLTPEVTAYAASAQR